MTSDFILTLALSLIAAAIALGLLTYILILIRRKDEEAEGEIDDQPDDEEVEMEEEKPAPAMKDTKVSPAGEAAPIADLMRSEKTGRLVVRIGDREFAKAADIRDPEILARLTDAAAELTQWLAAGEKAKPPAAEAPPSKPVKTPIRPKNMIDEINEIIELRIEAGNAPQGLRLFEGPEGTVRAYVGVNSFEFEEIPDQKIQRIIKEAVAEWEARQ